MRLALCCLLASLTAFPCALPAREQVWRLAVDRWGTTEYRMLVLQASGNALAGTLDGQPLRGERRGDALGFTAGDPGNEGHRFEGRLVDGRLQGRIEYPDTNDRARKVWHAVHGWAVEEPPAAQGPRRFEPQVFHNAFDADAAPALVIRPGEVIATSTLDSGGLDSRGDTRALYGNPQTGPFFVWGAKPGDVLAVRIHALRLDRDFADSLDGFAPRAMSLGMATRVRGLGKRVRWRLDREAGTATLEDAPEALRHYKVPLRPMLGGLGVAPGFGRAPQSSAARARPMCRRSTCDMGAAARSGRAASSPVWWIQTPTRSA